MPYKRKRRLGHITKTEKKKVGAAYHEAIAACSGHYTGRDIKTCENGVVLFDRQLRRRGFKEV